MNTTPKGAALATLQEEAPLSAAIVETMRGLDVVDAETCAQMADFRKRCNAAQKRLKERKKKITDPLTAVVREVNALFAPAEADLDDALTLSQRKLNGYAQQQLIIESERKAAALREAREAEAIAAKAAQSLRDAGAGSTAEVLEVQAAAQVAMASGPARVETVKSQQSTFSVRRHWVGRVLDVRAFCEAIGSGNIPVTCVNINGRALNDFAATLGEPMVAADPAKISELYIHYGFAIELVAEGATR